MKKVWLLLALLSVSIIVIGCSDGANEDTPDGATRNPTAEDILSDNPTADIFMLNGIIYSKADDVDWVSEQEYIIGEEAIEVTKQTTNSEEFENGTASKLPVGTKIYEADLGDVYIVVIQGEEIPYLGLREG